MNEQVKIAIQERIAKLKDALQYCEDALTIPETNKQEWQRLAHINRRWIAELEEALN